MAKRTVLRPEEKDAVKSIFDQARAALLEASKGNPALYAIARRDLHQRFLEEEAATTGREIERLDEKKIASLTTPGRYRDGNGLVLCVSSSGSKSWSFIYKFDGKERQAGLGSLTKVNLTVARKLAAEWRAKIGAGIDPLAEAQALRQAEKAKAEARKTFGEAAESLLKAKAAEWTNAKHAAQWRATLETYCSPIWKTAVADIGVDDLLPILEPLWAEKVVTGSRLRTRLESVFDHATVKRWRSGANPARWKGNLAELLAKPGKLKAGRLGPQRALPYAKMPAFFADLEKIESVTALALKFLILTAVRSGEVRGARWYEISFEDKMWTIPKERTKTKKADHRVPLSAQAIAVLKKMEAIKGAADSFVFPGRAGKSLSDRAMAYVLRCLGVNAVAHGFRSSFKDYAAEKTDYANELSEAALGHAIPNAVEAAYRRGDLFEKRRALMADWSNYCLKMEVSA
jgi:integrase